MKKICYLLSGVLMAAVIFLNLTIVNSVFSMAALYFCLWGILPWLYVVLLVYANAGVNILKVIAVLTLLVGGAGIVGMVDVVYFNPDAQGALFFVFLPLYQMAFFLVITPLIYFLAKRMNATIKGLTKTQ